MSDDIGFVARLADEIGVKASGTMLVLCAFGWAFSAWADDWVLACLCSFVGGMTWAVFLLEYGKWHAQGSPPPSQQ